jgi:hypothetical protein
MQKYKQKLEQNFILYGTCLIIIASIISFILEPIKEVSIWGFYSRNNGILAYICLFSIIYFLSNLKVKSKHVTFMLHGLNVVSIVLVIIGTFQFFGQDMMNSLWFKKIYFPTEYKQFMGSMKIMQPTFYRTSYFLASSLLGQFNYFGAYCSIMFPLITAFALNENKAIRKILLMIGSIMLFIGILLAQSMGSIIALLLVLLIIPIFLVNKRNYISFILMFACYTIGAIAINRLTSGQALLEIYNIANKIINSKLFVLAIVIAIIYILLYIFRMKIYRYRYLTVSIIIMLILLIGTMGFIYTLNNVAEHDMGVLSSRGYIWHYSNELIKENFIFGYGPDNLYYNFPQINPHKEQYMPNDLIDKPHNMYLQVLLDTGIFGLIGFMILLVGLLLKSNKAIDFEDDLYKKTYFKALMLVIAAYMIQGIVNDNHMTIQPTVYLIFGIGASLIKQTLDKAKLSSPKK